MSLLSGQAGAADNGWIDSASFEFGTGPKVRLGRLAVQKDWDSQWFASNGRHLSGYWDLSAAWWRSTSYRNVPGQHQNLAVVGITPVLRYQRDDKLGWYAEAGIGANLFSELYNNDGNRLSTAFQFGDHLGIGYVTPTKWDLGLKFQHYSNASIKRPNNGANFVIFGARYKF
ncbi:acyloxyacyl hydrolase [Massilia sp. CMS3.1]|uniref:acyloxyacyl hydrolase n=1 Tax=Massilia sp. CMS3.1 TaxID=3373083 RepID=UPI003EE7124A